MRSMREGQGTALISTCGICRPEKVFDSAGKQFGGSRKNLDASKCSLALLLAVTFRAESDLLLMKKVQKTLNSRMESGRDVESLQFHLTTS